MKKFLFTILFAAVLPIFTFAQLPSDEIFEKYKNKEGYEVTAISSFMIQPFADNLTSTLKADEKDLVNKAIKSIKGVNIILANNNTAGLSTFLSEAGKTAKNSKYSTLIDINKNPQSIKIVTHKVGSTITEIFGFGGDNNQKVLFSIQGNFTEEMVKEFMAKAQKYY